jgi:hypothetical protein|tara:strand:+ start:10752 stop:11231 length:480 start_codon:yes stop_codon:yes gene_type:complete
MSDSAGVGVGDLALQILNSNAMTPTNPGGKTSGIPDISDEGMAALGIDTSRIGLEGIIQETTSVGQVGVNLASSSTETPPQLGLPGMETVPYLDKKKPSNYSHPKDSKKPKQSSTLPGMGQVVATEGDGVEKTYSAKPKLKKALRKTSSTIRIKVKKSK